MQDSPIVLTTLAGLSTGVGGLLAVLCPPSERLLAASAGFAGGVMLTASLADLMPEALAFYGATCRRWHAAERLCRCWRSGC
ncbi:MAG: hypothetical protein ACLSCW_01280 [Gemmiger formicilis]